MKNTIRISLAPVHRDLESLSLKCGWGLSNVVLTRCTYPFWLHAQQENIVFLNFITKCTSWYFHNFFALKGTINTCRNTIVKLLILWTIYDTTWECKNISIACSMTEANTKNQFFSITAIQAGIYSFIPVWVRQAKIMGHTNLWSHSGW